MKLVVAGLALTMALAGCLGTGSAPLVPSNAPAVPAVHALGFTGCLENSGFFSVPADAFASEMPEGFTLATDGMGMASLGIVSATCRTARGPVAMDVPTDAPEASEVYGFVVVNPPDAYKVEGIGFYVLLLGVMTSSAENAEAYKAWGIDMVGAAEVTVESLAGTPALSAMHTLGAEQGFTVHLYTTAEVARPEEPGIARAFITGHEEGSDAHVLKGAVDLAWNQGEAMEGQGVLRMEGDMGMPMGLPMPPQPGYGFQVGGENYGWHITHVMLPTAPTEAPAAAKAPAPLKAFKGLVLA